MWISCAYLFFPFPLSPSTLSPVPFFIRAKPEKKGEGEGESERGGKEQAVKGLQMPHRDTIKPLMISLSFRGLSLDLEAFSG